MQMKRERDFTSANSSEAKTLEEFVQQCTMRIGSTKQGGTGFFVAPGRILTCAHVVREEHAQDLAVDILWQSCTLTAHIVDFRGEQNLDIAMLSVDVTDHPCVYLETTVAINDPLWCYGYPDEFRDLGSGDSVSFQYEGPTHLQGAFLLKMKGGQARPGLSGAPLLNRRTGAVCGIVKSTRNRSNDLGGRAVPISEVLPTLGIIASLQSDYHARDSTWSHLRLGSQHTSAIPDIGSPNEHQQGNWPTSPSHLPTRVRDTHGPLRNVTRVRYIAPRRVRSFTGRVDEIGRISSFLEEHDAPNPGVVAIYGLSGVGKTQLCREYLNLHKDNYRRTLWISANDSVSITSCLAQFAIDRQLAGADPQDLEHSSSVALQWLEQHHDWLLVFDNASPTTVGPFLPSIGRGHILISSTNPNWSAVTTNELRLEGLSRDCSIQFLTQRSGLSDVAAAGRIADSFDGLPLALEQAASYIQRSRINFTEYEQLLEKHRAVLLDEKSSFTDYPMSVYSALMLSVEHAAEDFPHIIALLAFIAYLSPDRIPRDLVKDAVNEYYIQANEEFDILIFNKLVTELSEMSLIVAENDYISTHPLVQAFIRDSMSVEYRAAWSCFVLNSLAYEFPVDSNDSSSWRVSETLIRHVMSSMKNLDFPSCDDEFIETLYANAGSYLHARGRDDEAINLLQMSLGWTVSRYGMQHPLVALASNNLLSPLAEVGRDAEALDLGTQAIESLSQNPETRIQYKDELGKVLSNVGRIHLNSRRSFQEARSYFLNALGIHLEMHGLEHFTPAIDINNLGTVEREEAIWASKLGLSQRAQTKWKWAYGYFLQAVSIHRKVLRATDYRLAIALFNLGQAANNLGKFEEAEKLLREAVEINDNLHNGAKGSDQIEALLGLGQTLRSLGRPSEAIVVFDRAKEIGMQLYGNDSSKIQSVISARGEVAFDLARPFFCRG